MSDLSGIVGDTNTYTLAVLRNWTTVLIVSAEIGDQFLALGTFANVEVGDTLTVGTEQREVTGIGEGVASFDDPLEDAYPVGTPVYGVGPIDLGSAVVTFHVGDSISKVVTTTDPDGAAIVTLDPADTADVAVFRLRHFWWDLVAEYEDGSVKTLARGRYSLSQRAS